MKVAGPAFTVEGRPGDNLMIHAALCLAKPGDLIVGDADGVVVVPREMAADIVGQAQAKVDAEAERMKQIARGELVQGWVAEGLRSVGVLRKDEKL